MRNYKQVNKLYGLANETTSKGKFFILAINIKVVGWRGLNCSSKVRISVWEGNTLLLFQIVNIFIFFILSIFNLLKFSYFLLKSYKNSWNFYWQSFFLNIILKICYNFPFNIFLNFLYEFSDLEILISFFHESFKIF